MDPVELARGVAAGDAAAVRQFRGETEKASLAADRDALAALLDALAGEAAAGSKSASDELIATVARLRLAEKPIRKVLLDPHDVDDAVQATLVQIDRNIGQYEGGARFTTWLYRVAHNEALQLLRSKTRKEARDERGSPVRPEKFGISSIVADQEAVRAIIEALPDHHREVVLLREYDQLEYDEIAARLGVPVGTVRSRLARAREELDRELRVQLADRLAE